MDPIKHHHPDISDNCCHQPSSLQNNKWNGKRGKYPSLGVIYTVQTHCTGNGNKLFTPRHSTICTVVHDLQHRI